MEERYVRMTYGEFLQGILSILSALGSFGVAIYMLFTGGYWYALLFIVVTGAFVKYANTLTDDIYERSEKIE